LVADIREALETREQIRKTRENGEDKKATWRQKKK
jgi:hypothetical protein